MKFCPNCNLSYPDEANVCSQCGGQLSFVPNQFAQAPVDPFDHTAEFDRKDISDNKVTAMAPYLMGVLGLIIVFLAAGNSPYAAFHARQALKIQVVTILLGIVSAVLFFFFIVPIAGGICIVILGVIDIICFFNVCNGKAKDAPIIRKLGFLK
ncbi:MAG: DUF4870 domain-containing protein [Oscillospiraceae bacterium]|nr:DUF4870 domain-containing protein [Oscillospiraceae bacterium]